MFGTVELATRRYVWCLNRKCSFFRSYTIRDLPSSQTQICEIEYYTSSQWSPRRPKDSDAEVSRAGQADPICPSVEPSGSSIMYQAETKARRVALLARRGTVLKPIYSVTCSPVSYVRKLTHKFTPPSWHIYGRYKVGLGDGEIKPCTAAQDGLYQQDPGPRERVLTVLVLHRSLSCARLEALRI